MTRSETPRRLARFVVEREGDGFRLEIGDEDGGKLELTATEEQLDVIVEALDDVLADSDEFLDDDDDE